jgi:hypothetical protein
MATIRSRIITPNAYARPSVTIKERPQVTITPRPDVEVAVSKPVATLICDTTPTGAEVTVAAKTLASYSGGTTSYSGGTTPVTLTLIPYIPYTLTFKKEGYKTVTSSYLLEQGETRTVNVVLPLLDLPSEEPKIDVILFTLPPSCVIGDRCEGNITLKNNTDGTLDGFINVGMQGAIPVPPTTYSIPAHATETVVFEIPTVGLTITGIYILELEMLVGDDVAETASGSLEILPIPEYEVTITSEPASATVVVEEA